MLRVIARLEALAGELACANATDEEIAGVRAMHDRDDRSSTASASAWNISGVNQEIHLEIVRIARNEVLRAMHAPPACPHEAHPLPRQRHPGQLGGGGRRSRRRSSRRSKRATASGSARSCSSHLDDVLGSAAPRASRSIRRRCKPREDQAMTQTIGFIGLGLMGAGFTRRLIATGHRGHRLRSDAARDRAGRKASACEPAASARRGRAGGRHHPRLRHQHRGGRGRDVSGPRGIAAGDIAGKVVVDHSTTEIKATLRIAGQLSKRAARRSSMRRCRAGRVRPRAARSPSWRAATRTRSRASRR